MTQTQPIMEERDREAYSKHDHYHCWQSKNPPCGQKIEHLKCCLCEKLNPKTSKQSTLIEKLREKFESSKLDKEQSNGEKEIVRYIKGYNQALDDFRNYIDEII